MHAIIFCGIQATGKSSFYKQHFFNSHIRISMDLLNTRKKEQKLLELCLQMQASFVVDNTNPTRAERELYIHAAKEHKYKVTGYYFSSKLSESLKRNAERQGKEVISDVGIRSTYSKLELPSVAEGFDELFYVDLADNNFIIHPWTHEV